MNNFPKTLIDAYYNFKNAAFPEQKEHYKHLATDGQNPKVMVIACCDSRVDVNSILSFGTGELFVVRNVANLVPPFEIEGKHHGVSAAIEYAALNLKVEHIVILGHSKCGGVAAALDSSITVQTEANFITKWMSILDEPKAKVEAQCGHCDHDVKQYELEKDGIIHSLENLRTFPCIKYLEDKGRIGLWGAHFDIETGDLRVYNQEINKFEII